jgi:hypothetical protein
MSKGVDIDEGIALDTEMEADTEAIPKRIQRQIRTLTQVWIYLVQSRIADFTELYTDGDRNAFDAPKTARGS